VGVMVLAGIASLAGFIIMLIGSIDVVSVKILNWPVPAAYESTEALMAVIALGGLAYTQKMKRHVRVELLIRHWPPKAQVVADLASHVFGVLFFGLLTWRSYLLFLQSWQVMEAGPSLIRFPIYPTKLVMILACGMMTLQLLIDIFRSAKALRGATPGSGTEVNRGEKRP